MASASCAMSSSSSRVSGDGVTSRAVAALPSTAASTSANVHASGGVICASRSSDEPRFSSSTDPSVPMGHATAAVPTSAVSHRVTPSASSGPSSIDVFASCVSSESVRVRRERARSKHAIASPSQRAVPAPAEANCASSLRRTDKYEDRIRRTSRAARSAAASMVGVPRNDRAVSATQSAVGRAPGFFASSAVQMVSNGSRSRALRATLIGMLAATTASSSSSVMTMPRATRSRARASPRSASAVAR